MILKELREQLQNLAAKYGEEMPVRLVIEFRKHGQWEAECNGSGMCTDSAGETPYAVLFHEEILE